MDSHDEEVLAALEQELLAPAVRRLRRRFCAAAAAVLGATVAGLAVVGLAALPVLSFVMVGGALFLVARTLDPPAPADRQVRDGTPRARRQPLGCSTKS